MSTDLREAMRQAVMDGPAYGVDAGAVIDAGARRIRRRTRVAVGASALVVTSVLVATAVVSRPEGSDPAPSPAEVVHIDLEESVSLRTDVLASTRTTWRDARSARSLEYDRYEGITADGLVLRSRYTNDHGFPELGLLDLSTGVTDWLPPTPVALFDPIPVDLTTDRLVLFKSEGNGHSALVFDRAARTWQRDVVRLPYGIEVHMPPRVVMGPDGRVYIGTWMEGESGPIHWWSASVPGGGEARPEPTLEGATVAWGGGVRATADSAGRVVVSGPAGDEVVADGRPEGCEPPEAFPDAPVTVLLAGDRPVVTYTCETGTDVFLSRTVVHPQDGRAVEIVDASVLATDNTHVVLAGGGYPNLEHPGHSSTYVLDLDQLAIARVGRGTHEPHVALVDGLLLWNSPGPTDDNDGYDVTWQVARIR